MKTWLIEQNFRILYEQHRSAWKALRETHGIIRDFQGEYAARTLIEMCDHMGLKAAVNGVGDIVQFKAQAIEEYVLDSFFRDLAPFVASGSTLAFFNEQSLRTTYTFGAGQVFKDEKKMAYTSDEDTQFDEEI